MRPRRHTFKARVPDGQNKARPPLDHGGGAEAKRMLSARYGVEIADVFPTALRRSDVYTRRPEAAFKGCERGL